MEHSMCSGNMRIRARSSRLWMLVSLSVNVTFGTALVVETCTAQPSASGQVLGHQACVQCHKTEYDAWTRSPHAVQSFQDLEHVKAADFAKAIGVSGDLTQSVCASCHATEPQATTVNGVSCESCHGAAGPQDGGWYKVHSLIAGESINPTMVDLLAAREAESEQQRQMRHAAADAAGMNRSAELYDIAKNCLSCHTVAVEQLEDAEKLVNAGHPTSEKFELVRFSQGSVRHNFLLDHTTNAESPSLWLAATGSNPENRKKLMYVTGQLVDLEISLHSRSMASDGDYGKAVGDRIEEVIKELEDLEHISEVQAALNALKQQNIDEDRLQAFMPDDKQVFGSVAEEIQQIAKRLIENHPDGSDLGDVGVSRRSEGDAYEP